MILPGLILLGLLLAQTTVAFKELVDGARIPDPSKQSSSYSIPSRITSKQLDSQAPVGERIAGVLSSFDDDEYTLISKMKTMETPPSPDAVDYYAKNKHVGGRFHQGRARRSTVQFESDKPSPSSSTQPRSISFAHDEKSSKDSSNTSEGNKRFFPELFGIHTSPPYGGGGGYYPPPPHHYPNSNYYPNTGGHYYQPPYYNNHHGGYYPPHHGGYGNGGSSSSASASSSSSSGYRPSGLYGNNYGNGYYPPGGVAPILGPAYGYPGGGFLGGFFRDEDGKGGGVAVSSRNGGKSSSAAAAAVSFGE